MSKLLIVSFDAVSDSRWLKLREYPHVKKFADGAQQVLGVRSLFLSNTYPIHCSVLTGQTPGEHRLISNTEAFPARHPRWVTSESAIKQRTIAQVASAAGLSVASFLWPVTGGSKSIRWNLPELPPLPGQNQAIANLKAGTKWMQIGFLKKYGKLLDGINQPALDDFTTACATDILRRKKPDLCLVHLTAYDSLCHKYGPDAEEMDIAFEALDRNIGKLMNAAGEDTAVIVFSDHSQVGIHTVLTPNDILADMGRILKTDDGYAPGASSCFIECCGGSAFFHGGDLGEDAVSDIRACIEASEGFGRFLTEDEMRECGRGDLAFGFGAEPGYMYDSYKSAYKGNHGYPLDAPDYKVFYALSGSGAEPGESTGGSLLDIAPMALDILGIE